MTGNMDVDTVVFAKAIADETRVEIMKHLRGVWLSVNDIVDKLDGKVNQPTVSHHLKKLENANLVLIHQEGRQRFYTLNHQQIVICFNQLLIKFKCEIRYEVDTSIPKLPIDGYSHLKRLKKGLRLHVPRAREILKQSK